ncbi:MAG: hypothetical protein H6623_07365 [Bdellovibrionaceae bacterium]|nr:hypothetical protein [Pseudobdellovibrionaceae bacterium]
MKKKVRWIYMSLYLVTLACGQNKSSSSNDSSCNQRLPGKGGFGLAAYGCSLPATAAFTAQSKYVNYVVDESKTLKEEQSRFVKDMHSYIEDYASEYLRRREPSANDDDMQSWVQLVMATAQQESVWTQYRLGSDGQWRFLRGDSGHGYGLMQIDDRWHQDFVETGKVYDLTSHFIYALDMLYQARKIAKNSPCSSSQNTNSINRSSYSIYNGGKKAKCRWLNKHDRWAKNDTNFYDKYTRKGWEDSL